VNSQGGTVDVVIPARNEDETIGQVVSVLRTHPAIGRIFVVVDKDTADFTTDYALSAIGGIQYGEVLNHMTRGKGQGVTYGTQFVTTKYVLYCDADITGLTYDHISLLLSDAIVDGEFMTIGVPDIPDNYPTARIWAWPWVSGQRCVPVKLVRPLRLHGYLMETQINAAAKHSRLPLRFEWLDGLKSSYYMGQKRIDEMELDAAFGRAHGLLP
jgi:glycosyltransferase involved in cell wall biosynthesis